MSIGRLRRFITDYIKCTYPLVSPYYYCQVELNQRMAKVFHRNEYMLGRVRLRKRYARKYSARTLLKHTTGYDMANQTAYLDDMLRWSLDWLIKVRLGDHSFSIHTLKINFARLIHNQTHYSSKLQMVFTLNVLLKS